MGQRLVITIKNEKKNLAKAYYHWSGYTSSGLQISNIAIQHHVYAIGQAVEFCTLQAIIKNTMKTTSEPLTQSLDLLTACSMLFRTRAGLSNEYDKATSTNPEIDAFVEAYPGVNYTIGVNRNDGIIGITKEGMTHLQEWSEADVIINIHSKTVNVSGLFFDYDDSNNEDDEDHMCTDIPETYDMTQISFEEFPKFVKTVTGAISDECYDFKYKNNHLGVIE